jgi:hypothetical protein
LAVRGAVSAGEIAADIGASAGTSSSPSSTVSVSSSVPTFSYCLFPVDCINVVGTSGKLSPAKRPPAVSPVAFCFVSRVAIMVDRKFLQSEGFEVVDGGTKFEI